MKKERFNVEPWLADEWAEELAWKRAGFGGFDELKDIVRNMTLEEKIDILTT